MLREIFVEQNFDFLNSIINDYILTPIQINPCDHFNMPPVFIDACKNAIKSNIYANKVFLILLYGFTTPKFQTILFQNMSEDKKHLLLLRFQSGFDAFLKGLYCDKTTLALTPYTKTMKKEYRSFGYLINQLRSYYIMM